MRGRKPAEPVCREARLPQAYPRADAAPSPSGQVSPRRALPRADWQSVVRGRLRAARRRWVRIVSRPPAWPDGEPRPAASVSVDGARVSIVAADLAAARSLLRTRDLTTPVRGLILDLTNWRAPWPGWSGRVGPVPSMVEHSVRLPATGRGSARVAVEVGAPVAAYHLLDAALAAVDPARPWPAVLTPVVAAEDGRPAWLRHGVIGSPAPAPEPPRPRGLVAWLATKTVARPATPTWTPVAKVDESVSPASWLGVRDPDGRERILVDAVAAGPVGRGSDGAELARGVLSVSGRDDGVWWRVSTGRRARLVATGRAGDALGEAHRSALRRMGTVTLASVDPDLPPAATASALAQLAMTGLVIHAPTIPAAVRALLTDELADVLTTPAPGRRDDPIQWELRSVAQRRAALRGHGAGVGTRPLGDDPPPVSALLVTRRPSYLARVLADLRAQTYPNLEVVLGLHGVDLDARQRDLVRESGLSVTLVAIPGELTLGEALAAATRRASGSFVTKVDDDDRYGPEHIWDLVLARHYSGATVAGRAAEFVYLTTYDTTIRRRVANETYTDVVAGGTILIGRGDLEHVGGWRPVPRSVDRALLDRVRAAGGLVYRTHSFGFIYTRHRDGHTWDPGERYFLRDPVRHWPGLPPWSGFAADDAREFGEGGARP